ncbi:MAG: valine--tRNA ligase [Nanoarchaeota archaeon]
MVEVMDTERKISDYWKQEKIYAFDPRKKMGVYSIDTPPPTVSGDMHVGHAFSYSQQDFVARFRRMMGDNVFYPFGTDDNGLPTERLVEKLNGVKSREMSRAEFIELCLKTLNRITPSFVNQWKNLGISCDYDLFYSTIDLNSQRISQKSFIELYRKGLIYKKDFPTLWCPDCQTAIAQAELEDKEESSKFVTLKFFVDDKELHISTTRPELIPACVGLFVNPRDERYKWTNGKKARAPLFNFEVPIIQDESADMKKGTGAMMVCSYGDKYDVEAIRRHKLTPKIILEYNGTLNLTDYKGMKIKDARKKIIEELEAKNLVVIEEPITHAVNVHDKCGTEVEFLPTEQWFIRILDKKKEWLALGRKIKWHPEYMRKRYENWVAGLDWDWTISRNRHFGIPIPVWQCKTCGEIVLPDEKELPIDPIKIKVSCPICKGNTEPETKVLDTWATSSLTPQIISSLVDGKVKIPLSLRPQAHEIIRTWTFYTIVKSYLHEKKLPWKNIMISGFVTLQGEKMSKSKGNVINPNEVMGKYGADALRFWAAGSKLGENLDYREEDVLAGKKFITKLRNASNFVFMNLKNYKPKKPKKMEKIDELFLKELNKVILTTTFHFEAYEYSKAKSNAEEFFWKDFCDNYLEIVKWRVYNGTKQEKESAFYTLYQSLLTILKLIAPIMPFVTEELYQKYYRKNEKDKSIHVSRWPKSNANIKLMSQVWPAFLEIISRVRQEKSTAKKSMNSEIILRLDEKAYKSLNEVLGDLKHVTNAKEIKEGKEFKVEFAD